MRVGRVAKPSFFLREFRVSLPFSIEYLHLRDWSLITGREATKWEIAGPKVFAAPLKTG